MTHGFRHLDIEIVQGSTFRLSAVYEVDEVPVDVSNWQARLSIRQDPTDEEALLELTEVDGITVGTTDGLFEIVITDEQTADLDIGPGPGRYDFEVESTGGEVTQLLYGKVGFQREVTR